LQIFGSTRDSAAAICNFLFLQLAFCSFLQIDVALTCNLQNKNFAFVFFKDDFYWTVSIMEQNLNCDPRRAICNNSNFEFCILQLFTGLSACQLARCKENILHFVFCIFCKHAISQKLSANIEILQFAKKFCILGKFCKKVMISKYPPLD
jgi:hypothetical protein